MSQSKIVSSPSNTRRILLAVSGMSPQIITETLYALFHDANWLPDEIHLITTLNGRERANLQLLQGAQHFNRLLKELKTKQKIHFDMNTMHVITDRQGNCLEDLKTPADNEAAADFITEKIRQLTSDENTELHVSLAGGRKTMGFYAGYALSLFGRQQDRLSHVLVSSDYESLPDFFYPTKKTHVIYKSDKTPLDAAKAEVWLAQIPFVRLRRFLSDDALLNNTRFSDAVHLVESMTNQPDIYIDMQAQQLKIGEKMIRLNNVQFALYVLFAKRAKQQLTAIHLPKGYVDKEHEKIAKEFLAVLRKLKDEMGSLENTEQSLKKGMDRDYFDSLKTKTNKACSGQPKPDTFC